MVLLYHYTDAVGKDGIYSAGRIYANDSGDGLGRVVKFTELPHGAPKADLVADIWGASPPPNALDRLRYWFKFEQEDLPSSTCKVMDLKRKHLWTCLVDVPLQSGPGQHRRTILYHYTDEIGKDAIYESGFIKAMRPHGGQGAGATMPVGVYFTEIIPTAPTNVLIFNMYGTRDLTKYPETVERTRFWFKFDPKDIPGVKKRQTRLGRNEWFCEKDVRLSWSSLV